MDEVGYDEERDDDRPKPDDFDTFLPWACQQHQVNATVIVVRVVRADYVGAAQSDRPRAKARGKPTLSVTDLEPKAISESTSALQTTESAGIIKIIAYYNSNNDLIEIKFEKNWHVPRVILKIIGLILPFHKHLNAVTINRGIDKFVIYELQKWLGFSNITDVCLDNTFFSEASYEILLETQSQLRQLSLARCGINDRVCQNIASKLVYPQPGSLSALNLSSNRITDLGAKFLGNALRSNRKLFYLNLAGNMIGDDGAGSILNSLREFSLTSEELLASRSRHITYLKKRNELVDRLVIELRASDFDRKAARRKSMKVTPGVSPKKLKGIEKDVSLKNMHDPKSLNNIESLWYEKAQAMAYNMWGEFEDPFSSKNTVVRDGVVYCCGNNTMCYLNVAYNSLSFFCVKKLLNVLVEQKLMDRKPKGLLNVVIEGNYMPTYCTEMTMIDRIIDQGLILQDAKMFGKKKTQLKSNKIS